MPTKSFLPLAAIDRPLPSEYQPYYARYVDQVPAGDILDRLEMELETTLALLASIGPELETYRYEPDKWSVREVVGHLIDVERTFGYRALCFARCDPAPLPSMDQDLWASHSAADSRSLDSLGDEFAHLRRGHVAMFRGLEPDAWRRRGTASEYSFTVRCLPFILAGHEIHHRRVLERRYLRRG